MQADIWLVWGIAVLAALALGWLLGRAPLAALRRRLEEELGGHAETRVQLAGLAERAGRADSLDQALQSVRTEREGLASRLAALEAASAERDRAHDEKLAALTAAGEALKAEFQRLAGEALKGQQTQFLEVAAQTIEAQRKAASAELEANKAALAGLLNPVAETLGRYELGLKAIEEKREQAYGSLTQQLAAVAHGQGQVQAEALRLATALRSSTRAAGTWGESQLRNVLELAGLREGIDFTLQTHSAGEDGGKRPDAIIRLPGGRELIVDAKCSLADYLDAAGADEEGRRLGLVRHATRVKAHAQGLAQKAYWTQFAASADFVVLFLPGENYLSAALEHDTGLLDWAFQNRILLAGPINLLAIAKTVALVWRQEKLAADAREIGELGADLYKAVADMGEHVAAVGKNLGQALAAHNSFVGSLERNVLPKARRFLEHGVNGGKKPVPELGLIEGEVRGAVAPELLPPPRADAAA